MTDQKTQIEMGITKSQVECYKIRPNGGSSVWADITLDVSHSGDGGRISIASDYGDWQYYWGSCGDFKDFLISIGKDYAAGKFGCDKVFDKVKTVHSFKKDIFRDFKNGSITNEVARIYYDQTNILGYCITDYEFRSVMEDLCEELLRYYNYSPDFVYIISPSFSRFWNEIWPYFIKYLKQEIEQESK